MVTEISPWHGYRDMTEAGEQLRAVLDGYANFLVERELALPKHQPYLVRWMREFLHFALERAATRSSRRWTCS